MTEVDYCKTCSAPHDSSWTRQCRGCTTVAVKMPPTKYIPIKEIKMSLTAMKQALMKVKSAQQCHPNATWVLLDEAEKLLCIAVAGAGVCGVPLQVGECWCDEEGVGKPGVSCGDCPRDYAEPAQAHKALSDRQIGEVIDEVARVSAYGHHHTGRWMECARAIEAKIKEQK